MGRIALTRRKGTDHEARGLYDAEYDRVREAAGYSRLHVKTEFPESTIDERGRTVEDRVETMRLDAHERMNLASLSKQEAEKEAERKRRHDELRVAIDKRIMEAEYERLKIAPPYPPHSLGFMILMGWRVEQIGDQNVLVGPPWLARKEIGDHVEDE